MKALVFSSPLHKHKLHFFTTVNADDIQWIKQNTVLENNDIHLLSRQFKMCVFLYDNLTNDQAKQYVNNECGYFFTNRKSTDCSEFYSTKTLRQWGDGVPEQVK